MIGVLGYEDLRDQCLGRDAALHNASWCGRPDNGVLARATAVARPARDQHAKRGRQDIEPLGHILADLVERATATTASLAVDVDHLLDTFQMRWQGAAVGFAWPSAARLAGIGLDGGLSLCQCDLDFLKAKLELVGIELLRSPAETMALQSSDDGFQSLHLGLRRLERIDPT
jgi:hypothetical protein